MLSEIPDGWSWIKRESGLIEWQCPHGVGHPAPKEHQSKETLSYAWWGIHGCDGCCDGIHKK